MFDYKNGVIRTSVRRLVEFLLRSGDICVGGGSLPSGKAMLEGARLHRKIQESQPPDYRSEVPLTAEWEKEGYRLVLEGRADGIGIYRDPDDGRTFPMIDEIKCVGRSLENMEEAEFLHMAQAKCYAAVYCMQESLPAIAVQITYCHRETEDIRRFVTICSADELESWFQDLIRAYDRWAARYVKDLRLRDESIEKLTFPFSYRPGQKKLTAIAWQSAKAGDHVFLQAPTGVGKTISTIYPALKEIGTGKGGRIFYLTARTTTGTVAEDTLALLRDRELFLHSATISSKEKICPFPDSLCDPRECQLADGHYDRINECLFALLSERRDFTRETILDYSRLYQVCPYELAFEAAAWSDFVICDYNYLFDPHVSRKGLLSDQGPAPDIILTDEAHNLPDRAREMYSAAFGRQLLKILRLYFRSRSASVYRRLVRADKEMRELDARDDESVETFESNRILSGSGIRVYNQIDSLYRPLFSAVEALGDYLGDHDLPEESEVVDAYFALSHFFMILDSLDEGYLIYGSGKGMDFSLTLLCADPSGRLAEIAERCHANILFSATLYPVRYYRDLIGGGEWDAYSVPSPFDENNRLLMIASDVTSRYSMRGPEQYMRMVRYLEKTVEARAGHYMIFFPSYEMLQEVYRLCEDSTLSLMADLLPQSPDMRQEERETFLSHFHEEGRKSLVGFCVLGSIFSEGIDLTGSRLIGVLIVGTGIPGLGVEKEMVRLFFDKRGQRGYDYAYRYPGMNKVLQAAGRVIRTVTDRGIILLMDDRFLEPDNQMLFPGDWKRYYQVDLDRYSRVLEDFWQA